MSKRCEWCDNGSKFLCYDGSNDGVFITIDEKYAMIESDSWEININFCPFCGRELRKPEEK